MIDNIVISITKEKILINGMECSSDNYEEVFTKAGIGDHEAKEIIKLILDKRCRKWGVFIRE